MVRMVVELHLFVVVIRLEVTIGSPCSCHSTCLCSFGRTVVATEALTVIWDVKRLVVVLDGLQLLTIFCLIVYGYTISLIACVWYSSWVCLLYLPL